MVQEKDLHTIDSIKAETELLKIFYNDSQEIPPLYDNLFQTLDAIIQGQN